MFSPAPLRTALLALLLLVPSTGSAADAELETLLEGLTSKSRSKILENIEGIAELGDARALPALEALVDKRLRADEESVYILGEDDTLRDALSGAPVSKDEESLREPRINNRVRRAAKPVIAQLALRGGNRDERLAAALALESQPNEEAVDAIRAALTVEQDAEIRTALELALAQIDLEGDDPAKRIAAVKLIAGTGNRDFLSVLEDLQAQGEDGEYLEPDPDLRGAAAAAAGAIERSLFFLDVVENFFHGLSLASVLLLAALGLAITFGLMGVINMAHGEMLMVGAYTTYFVLGLFQRHAPAFLDLYLLAALPAAFVICALLGMALERGVIRHLYGRALDSLLATWGISLVLIQSVRMLFGAQNVEVANPGWLSGGYSLTAGVVFPYSRIAIIAFALSMVGIVYLMLQRTRLGLWVRAVTQNRQMAAGLGIPTARVDMLTFGLGSGIAGLGGVALSQIGNVGPDLGQSYIVDSFMVVVLGGVGKVIGTVVAAVGLGVINKLLEPSAGAVLGKIFVLGFLILFIQRRPQGIFALQGRAAES